MAGGLPEPFAVANQYQIDIWLYFLLSSPVYKMSNCRWERSSAKFLQAKSGNRSRYLDVSAAGLVVHVRGGSDL